MAASLPPYGTVSRFAPGLWVGGFAAAADHAFLRRAGIGRVVRAFADADWPGGGPPPPPPAGVRVFVLAAVDDPAEPLCARAGPALAFARAGRAAGEGVLFHCHAGVSRSPTLAALYLMVYGGYSAAEALAALRAARPCVDPNPGFRAGLAATDAALRRARGGDR